MKKLNYIVIPGLVLLVAVLGGWLTNEGVSTWYQTLLKPEINPPDWVFGPVWTAIYILAALSLIIVWNKSHEEAGWLYRWFHRKDAKYQEGRVEAIISLFILNAFLNVMWSFLFFFQHEIAAAFVEMFFLNATTLLLIILICPMSRWAAWFLVPYLVWVSFATYLTYLIWQLN